MKSSSHTLPSFSSSPATLGGSLALTSSPPLTSSSVSLPLSPVSFPPSPTSLSPATAEYAHSSSPVSDFAASQCLEGQSTQSLGQVNASDQDDLTCLSWLHQRGDLLPLQPLAKMTPLPQQQPCTAAQLPPPPASSKPPYSFSSLIFMAIEDSPQKRLPVKDIYEWIVSSFPYYRTATGGWRNSVRHNLSLSKSFRRIQRDKRQSVGKGSLWCVCPEYRPALLEALRKTHSYHGISSLVNKPALLDGTSYEVPAVCDTVEISDTLSHALLLSGSSPQMHTAFSEDLPCPLTPDHEELVTMEPNEVGEDTEKDPLSDSGYIELHYYESDQCQYLVLPSESELDLETVEILQLDVEAQEAAGSLLDLAGGVY
ncbi:forkhead box protein N2-like [Anableps anableps]